MDVSEPGAPKVSPFQAGIKGRCPSCGQGRMFSGYLTLRERCEACGLDYAFADAGDGAAWFVMLIVGFVVVGGALILEIKAQPPMWLHAAIWGPLTIALVLGLLRPLKGILLALQFKHKAAPGELEKP